MEKVFTDSSFQDEEAEKCTVEVKPDLIIKEERMDEEEEGDMGYMGGLENLDNEEGKEMARMNFEVIMEG